MQEEHQAIRKNKNDGESLNWEDYQKMDFTSNVIIINHIFLFSYKLPFICVELMTKLSMDLLR